MLRSCVLLAAVTLGGCSTTWATIHGPNFALGLDLDHNLDASPRFEAGYHWLLYKDAMGLGAGGVVAHSPVTGWTEIMAELNAWMFPFLSVNQTPVTFRFGGAFSEDEGAMLAFGIGLEGLFCEPPDSCNPPLEGPWEGCPPGVYLPEDTVYPDWVPRAGYLATFIFDPRSECTLDGACPLVTHTIKFDATFAWWTVWETLP